MSSNIFIKVLELVISNFDTKKIAQNDSDRILKLKDEVSEKDERLFEFFDTLKIRTVSKELIGHEASKDQLITINKYLNKYENLKVNQIKIAFKNLVIDTEDEEIKVKGVNNKLKNIIYNLLLLIILTLVASPVVLISLGDVLYDMNSFNEKITLLIISIPFLMFGIVGFHEIRSHFTARIVKQIIMI